MPSTDRAVYYAESVSVDLGRCNLWGDPRYRLPREWLRDRFDEFLGTDWVTLDTGERHPQPKIMTRGECPYCCGSLQFFGQPNNEPLIGEHTFAGECQFCGWWFCEYEQVRDPEGIYDGGQYYEGILTRLDIGDLDVPLDVLTRHLRMKFEDVRFIHPRTFETLCRDVLSEHFDCDVRLTGYSKDHGVDLYVIDGDITRAVQLKRRSKSVSEGVSPVREFLGAMIENETPTGIFISTADRFTKGARDLASSPSLHRQGINICLMDAHGLQELFDRRELKDKPWKQIPSIKPPKLFLYKTPREPRFPW